MKSKTQNPPQITGTANSQPKNVNLNEAIDSLDITYEKANSLLARIAGYPINEPSNEVCQATVICLRDTLDNGPNLIREKRELIEGILTEIEDSLF